MTLEWGNTVFPASHEEKFRDISGSFRPNLCYSAPARENQTTIKNFQALSRSPVLRTWLETPHSSHEFQELHAIYRLNPDWYTLHVSWSQLYDGVIYIDTSSPAQPIH